MRSEIFSWCYKDLKQLSVKPQGRENSINILLWQYKNSSDKIFMAIIPLRLLLNHICSVQHNVWEANHSKCYDWTNVVCSSGKTLPPGNANKTMKP